MSTTHCTTEARMAPPAPPPFKVGFDDAANPLHQAINMLRAINATNRLGLVARHAAMREPLWCYAATWGTVTCAAGQGTGNTSYIREHAQRNDLIIVLDDCAVQSYEGVSAVVLTAREAFSMKFAFRTIFVDDASAVFARIPCVDFYSLLPKQPDQTFILLG